MSNPDGVLAMSSEFVGAACMTQWSMMIAVTDRARELLAERRHMRRNELEAELRRVFPTITIYDVRDAVMRLASRGIVDLSDSGNMITITESPEAQTTINKRNACCMSKLKVFGTLAVNPDDVLAAGIYTEHTGQPQSTTANLSFVIAKGYVVIRVRDNDAAQFDANPEDVRMLLDHIKQSSK